MRTDEEIIEFSKAIPGYYEEDELRRLLSLTRALHQGATIVEIGVECGRSASIYLQCPENWSSLYLVDARTHNADQGRRWTERVVDECASLSNRTRLVAYVERFSADYARDFDGDIDLLHIDADHGPEVWNDLRLWLPKVAVGGTVVCHDYARKGADGQGDVFPSVTAAVNAYLRSTGVIEFPTEYELCEYPIGEEPVVTDPEPTIRLRFQALGVVNTQFAARRIA